MAAISYKGWASEGKIAGMTGILIGLLAKDGIAHNNNFL